MTYGTVWANTLLFVKDCKAKIFLINTLKIFKKMPDITKIYPAKLKLLYLEAVQVLFAILLSGKTCSGSKTIFCTSSAVGDKNL